MFLNVQRRQNNLKYKSKFQCVDNVKIFMCTIRDTYQAAPTTDNEMDSPMPRLAHMYGSVLCRNLTQKRNIHSNKIFLQKVLPIIDLTVIYKTVHIY